MTTTQCGIHVANGRHPAPARGRLPFDPGGVSRHSGCPMENRGRFNVWLANPQQLKYDWQALCDEVAKHFLYVTRETDAFDSATVRSTMTKPVLHANELLFYVLGLKDYSVVDDEFGPGGGTGGYTAFQRSGKHLTASEVYMHPEGDEVAWSPAQLAMIVYHEAMHNIFQEGDELHRRGRLGRQGSPSTTRRSIAGRTTRRWPRALSRMAPQWLDGWAYAKPFKKIDVNSGDPLDGL